MLPFQFQTKTINLVNVLSNSYCVWLRYSSKAQNVSVFRPISKTESSVFQTLPRTTAATTAAGPSTKARSASPNQDTCASRGVPTTPTSTTCRPQSTPSSGGATTSAVTPGVRCRAPGASRWTPRSGWTSVRSTPAVSHSAGSGADVPASRCCLCRDRV
jgi:hypothetical protein